MYKHYAGINTWKGIYHYYSLYSFHTIYLFTVYYIAYNGGRSSIFGIIIYVYMCVLVCDEALYNMFELKMPSF